MQYRQAGVSDPKIIWQTNMRECVRVCMQVAGLGSYVLCDVSLCFSLGLLLGPHLGAWEAHGSVLDVAGSFNLAGCLVLLCI